MMLHYSTAALMVAAALFLYWVVMALVGSMLPPAPGQERTRYAYWYRVAQLMAANIQRAAERKFGDLAGPVPPGLSVERTVVASVHTVAVSTAGVTGDK